MNEALFEQVKRKLNITWEDTDTNARIEDIIASAIPDLKHKLGIAEPDFDFAQSGVANTLFLAYCFYEFNHAINEFDENYARLIAQERARNEVKFFQDNGGNNEI